jgi:fructose-bisphosphate aldolase, class I
LLIKDQNIRIRLLKIGTSMNQEKLASIASKMVADGKGILAADESNPTVKKRFDSVEIINTEENRRAYRDLLFTTESMEKFISGVIFFDETFGQSTDKGVLFTEYLISKGVIPGIKVDKGVKPLPFHDGETITEGLDGLKERMDAYYEKGARFAKWRAVIHIDGNLPTKFAVTANAQALARYAAICQVAGIVPIVEPEVLMDGSHTIERCEAVTDMVLEEVFRALKEHKVYLEGMILKPNMVIPGKLCDKQAAPNEVASATVRCLLRHVPSSVPGIAFLSGGQSPQEATANLDAMNKIGEHPWKLTFSYGRALQATTLVAWKGRTDNLNAAKEAFLLRAKCNGAAQIGQYDTSMES